MYQIPVKARVTLQRLLRAAILPSILAFPSLFFVVDATHRASLTALGRDQGIFQYIAWAIEQGQVDYRDVRDVNGPLVHLVHFVFLKLGGWDEHRFRTLDLVVTGASFAVFGACLPGIGSVIASNRTGARAGLGLRPAVLVSRIFWAIAAWVILSAQYLSYLAWDLAQRESFCDWFVLVSLGLALVGQRAWRSDRPALARNGTAFLLASAALGCMSPLGKPTYVLFPIVQLAVLLLDDLPLVSRKKRLGVFAAGGIAGAAVPLAFLFLTGDARAFARITLVDVPTMYRFIWPRTAAEIFGQYPHYGMLCALAAITAILMVGLVVERQLPRRALAAALFPLLGVASMLAQKKGFPYHFHPITLGLYVQWIVLVAWLGERLRTTPRRSVVLRVFPLAAAAALSIDVAGSLQSSPHLGNLWILDKGRDAAHRESADYLVYFQLADFFPVEMRQAGAWLHAHTAATDRVQTYGMDPYLLFFARRLSATPYIYAYDLDADAALAGDDFPEGLHPDDAQMYAIRQLRDAHEADLLARMQAAPPAAFVYLDRSPLISWPDAHRDFAEHNPKAAPWVDAHYEEAAQFGAFHIWTKRGESPSGDRTE